MNWTTPELNPQHHAGVVLAIFKDGGHGAGWAGDGLTVLDPSLNPSGAPSRPPEDVVAWVTRCVCDTWRGSLWNRTKFPARENLASRTLYVLGEEAALVGNRDDVASIMRREWENHANVMVAGAEVEHAAAQVRAYGEALDAAVAGARSRGASWELIGQSVGVSKQTAHQRWGRVDAK